MSPFLFISLLNSITPPWSYNTELRRVSVLHHARAFILAKWKRDWVTNYLEQSMKYHAALMHDSVSSVSSNSQLSYSYSCHYKHSVLHFIAAGFYTIKAYGKRLSGIKKHTFIYSIYVCVCNCMYIYIYIYIYGQREKDRYTYYHSNWAKIFFNVFENGLLWNYYIIFLYYYFMYSF